MAERARIQVFVYAQNPDRSRLYYLDRYTSDLVDMEAARDEAIEELFWDELWDDGWEPVTYADTLTEEEVEDLLAEYRDLPRGTIYYAEVAARRANVELVLGEACIFADTPDDAASVAAELFDPASAWKDAESLIRLSILEGAVELSDEAAERILLHENTERHGSD